MWQSWYEMKSTAIDAPRGFVQSHGEAAVLCTGVIDHDKDGDAPADRLLQAQEEVRGGDHAPGRAGEHDERHGQGHEPANRFDPLLAVAVSQRALRDAKNYGETYRNTGTICRGLDLVQVMTCVAILVRISTAIDLP